MTFLRKCLLKRSLLPFPSFQGIYACDTVVRDFYFTMHLHRCQHSRAVVGQATMHCELIEHEAGVVDSESFRSGLYS